MTRAQNREEFIKAWESEFDILAMLSESLPTAGQPNIALEYLAKLRELRLKYIALAANDTYGARFCRYCLRMKDHADGQTGANAPGFHCELELVKPETGDLTAATCPEYAISAHLPIRNQAPHVITKEQYESKKTAASTAFESLKCEKCCHSLANHGTEGNTKGVCLVPGCGCGSEHLGAWRRTEKGASKDPTLNPKFLGKMAKKDPL
jgi:hypothetical protein